MKHKSSIKYFIALLLVVLIMLFLYKRGYFLEIEAITKYDLFILIFFTLLSYFVAGFQIFYLVKKQNKISISLTDILLLPLSMSLFSYIIPTNGGLLYSVFFLKKKYNLDASKGFSVGVVSIFISFIITGIFGIISCIYTDNFNIWILGMSFVLIFSPIVFNFFNKIFQKYSFKKAGLLYRMQSFINTIFLHSNGLMIDRSAIFVNILINVSYFTLSFVSYQWLNIILHVNLPLTSIFLILLISRISSLVRLLPGNLGLEELYMASIFEIIGKAPGIGIVFSLILRATTIIVFVPLGIIHFVINLKHIKLLDLKEALKKK